MPQRFSRLVRAVAIIGLASVPVVALGAPAYAGTSVQGREWWLRALHVVHAWRSGEGSGITVAVLADGVDARQADIVDSVIQGPDFTKSGRHPGGPHYGVIGTSLASLIAGHGHGKTNTRSGLLGIAPESRILSVRVTLSPGDPLWKDGTITSRLPGAIAAGIRYAVGHRAQVIELPADPSMAGMAGWGGVTADANGSAAERAAIAFALRRNVLLVAPAGDNARAGDAANYPAAYPGVISVGAVGTRFVRAPFSNRRPYVTLTAAGVGVIAATPSGYQMMNSTWAASAITAGVAALLRSQFPSLTSAQVRTALTMGARFRGQGGSGLGTLDASRAVRRATTMSPPHAVRAARGALPMVRPVPPRATSLKSVMLADLARDGEIAGAAFAALLGLIILYNALGRRSNRRVAVAGPREARELTQPETAALFADPLLEVFGPQHARPDDRPASQRLPASPRYQPRPALSGRSTLSGRSGPAAMAGSVQAPPGLARQDGTWHPGPPPGATVAAIFAAAGSPAPPPQASAAADSASAPGSAFRWAQRGESAGPMRPRVTGEPPWGPAPEPTTELPWAVVPGPVAGTAPGQVSAAPTRQAPPESLWNDAESSPPPTSPFEQAAPPFEPAPPPPGADPRRAAGPDTGGRPIYVWNPTGATEPFPAVSDQRPEPGGKG